MATLRSLAQVFWLLVWHFSYRCFLFIRLLSRIPISICDLANHMLHRIETEQVVAILNQKGD